MTLNMLVQRAARYAFAAIRNQRHAARMTGVDASYRVVVGELSSGSCAVLYWMQCGKAHVGQTAAGWHRADHTFVTDAVTRWQDRKRPSIVMPSGLER